jgi:glycosyltransferase involved in cell wall biosynthesis
VGTPNDDPHPRVGGLEEQHVLPLVFERGELDFRLPGMSDVMPYPSSRWSDLDEGQLQAYRAAWRDHIARAVDEFRPDVIHTTHVWLLSSLVKDVAPELPVLNHCHATGLRQMVSCPHLADEVRRGCARNDRFCVLHQGHADALARELGLAAERVHVVGAGYHRDVFHARGRHAAPGPVLVYAGKYSAAKGLPQLLDAVDRLSARCRGLVLHVAGEGAGSEAEALRARMAGMAGRVVTHGQLDQEALSGLLRSCAVFILPSFYEGLPLVLIEALACGCRLVCTDLPGIHEALGQVLAPAVDLVPLPRLVGPDHPDPRDRCSFVEHLASAIEKALAKPPIGDPERTMPGSLTPFTWDAVYQRIECAWLELITSRRLRRGRSGAIRPVSQKTDT